MISGLFGAGPSKVKVVPNQPYDEVVEVIDTEEVKTPTSDSTLDSPPRNPPTYLTRKLMEPITKAVENNNVGTASDEELEEGVVMKPLAGTSSTDPVLKPIIPPQQEAGSSNVAEENHSEESEEEEDDDDDITQGGQLEGAYDPAEYEHLPVTPEIKELFQYITRYTPQTIELDHKLKPFIPDFIPAVGDIDAFIKVPRPDGKPETLGLTVLDEPCAKQSDPTVLDLQLRAVSKQASIKSVVVKTLESAEKNPKEIDNWIKSISDLHKSKPPPNVHYSKSMPDIETLMQEWDPEFEELLKEVRLPTADLNCDLAQYVDVICGLLEIPVYKSKIQSLHVLFTLYSEFKNSQHFRQLAESNLMDNADKAANGVDRFVNQ